MSVKLLENFGNKLAQQWVATLLTPSFIFWAGGTVAALQRFGLRPFSNWLKQQPEPLQIAFLVGTFCVIVVSGFVVQRLDFPILRFLEGYWHPFLRPLRRYFIVLETKRSQKIDERWQKINQLCEQSQKFTGLDLLQLTDQQRDQAIQLIWQKNNRPRFNKKRLQKLTKRDLAQRLSQVIAELKYEFVSLDWQLTRIPHPDQLMPTRLGNILRFSEQRPLEKYGLDVIICWSRLWFLLPDAVKKDLEIARSDLNTAVRVWFWSLLFIVWTIWAWWAAPVSIISAIFVYYCWVLNSARIYSELVEAVFDLYRHLLYQSLRWGLPSDPNEERRVGQELTRYLWRGF